MPIDQSQVTIIIPILHKTDEQVFAFRHCLDSLRETTTSQIIVVKNGGLEIPYINNTQTKLILMENQGQCKAVNAAAATVNTPWIFVTNDDMIYADGWWERLTEGLEGKEEIRCVSPKLIEPISGAPTFEKFFCGGAGGDFDKAKWLEFAKNYQGQGLRTGFNLPFLIKKELWDLIGGYDVAYDPFGSNGDSDLEYKIKLAGIQSMQNTNSIVYHFSQTSGTSHPDNRPYWEKNWHYFIDKWGFERIGGLPIWDASFVIPLDKLKYKPYWMGRYGDPK